MSIHNSPSNFRESRHFLDELGDDICALAYKCEAGLLTAQGSSKLSISSMVKILSIVKIIFLNIHINSSVTLQIRHFIQELVTKGIIFSLQ